MRWRFGRFGTTTLLWACMAIAMEFIADDGSKYDERGLVRLAAIFVMWAIAAAIVYGLFVERDRE